MFLFTFLLSDKPDDLDKLDTDTEEHENGHKIGSFQTFLLL